MGFERLAIGNQMSEMCPFSSWKLLYGSHLNVGSVYMCLFVELRPFGDNWSCWPYVKL